jgi:hypothetical protein
MSLPEFQARGALLEIRVPWLPCTLWMVPEGRDAAPLLDKGVTRGRIWTAAELMNLMSIVNLTPETVRTIAHAKIEMDGEMTAVMPRPEQSAGDPQPALGAVPPSEPHR